MYYYKQCTKRFLSLVYLIVLLVDGLISIHDYPSFEPKMQLHKSKGTSYFATDLKVRIFLGLYFSLHSSIPFTYFHVDLM